MVPTLSGRYQTPAKGTLVVESAKGLLYSETPVNSLCSRHAKFPACAATIICLLLGAACNGSAPGQSLRSVPCPSPSGLANLSLDSISPEALAYLQKYSLPTTSPAEFCGYLERLQREHESKIEEGLIDMMGDYFWASQSIETGYYFSYKLRERPIPQIIQDRASSEEQM